MTRRDPRRAVDLCAGPGGWDVAAEGLGLDVVGVELDPDTVATRIAADLATVHDDVRNLGPEDFPNSGGLIGSPPCPTYSVGGTGVGRRLLDDVLAAVAVAADRGPVVDLADATSALVLEPLRWALEAIDAGAPFEWLAFEQVPPVLPVWGAMADVLEDEGYSVATGLLDAQDFGVSQTRKRAVLVASRTRPATLPRPTHPHPVAWTSVLGAPEGSFIGFPRRADRPQRITIGGVEYRARDLRPSDRPAFAVTSKVRSWEVFSGDDRRFLTFPEMGALQTFPPAYPWRGSRTSVAQQIGNAVPPRLAAAVLASIVDVKR